MAAQPRRGGPSAVGRQLALVSSVVWPGSIQSRQRQQGPDRGPDAVPLESISVTDIAEPHSALGGTRQRVALVTASGGMMGGAIARALASEGYAVVVNDRRVERTNAVAHELEVAGHTTLALTADVSTTDGAEGLVNAAVERFGCLDVLINVAGGIKGPIFNPIWEISDEQWFVTLATNLSSAFFTSRAALRTMMQQGSGCIVNIASTSWAGSGAHSHYAAAKAGLVSLTRSIATQVGPFGIRVNVIVPGGTKTLAALRSDGDLISDDSDHVKTIPLRRLNEPDDIADAVMYLVSSRARNVSGQILNVAGGINPSL